MDLKTSKNILKIFGILSIIGGACSLIFGLIPLFAGGLLAASGDEGAAVVGAVSLIGACAVIFSGLITLLQGIFSVNAVKNPAKATPAWIFSIIGFASAVIGVISNLSGGFSAVISPIITLIINGAIFVAANTVRQSA